MTTANIITIIRILLIPLFMATALGGVPYGVAIALGIFILASATDGVDGYIARKYNQVTTLGKFLDPLADKLLITAAILIFVQSGLMGAVSAMIILTREFAVTSLRIVAMGAGVALAANIWGKLKTVVQIIA
ncbi:MAG: CDP-diacylglycerol--glycerol-3-phosphate 3-phosphatidyltransferase, partial [Oscillospiraceae bacterium]|nr:CDP-diacylglycerol--glycerol-3-phosphate 3-phosphatidyltransferase [Oscillospiraceae bacterium]